MPRLSHSLLLRAHQINRLLPILLRPCRTLPSAQNELRWLREHAIELSQKSGHIRDPELILSRLVEKRSRGQPLQYLLGSQPFGDLDILCRPGVLIPRPETEAYTYRFAELIRQGHLFKGRTSLNVLDLCTGTGCIPLLLHSTLDPVFQLRIKGIDISDIALSLAQDNVKHNINNGQLNANILQQISFSKDDILAPNFNSNFHMKYDVVVSNPPYISSEGFCKDTARSVRIWEPRLALVPPELPPVTMQENSMPVAAEDVFYPVILKTALQADAKLTLMEVADTKQALRVAQMAVEMACWDTVEIWRDWVDQPPKLANDRDPAHATIGNQEVRFVGVGHGRSVVCRR